MDDKKIKIFEHLQSGTFIMLQDEFLGVMVNENVDMFRYVNNYNSYVELMLNKHNMFVICDWFVGVDNKYYVLVKTCHNTTKYLIPLDSFKEMKFKFRLNNEPYNWVQSVDLFKETTEENSVVEPVSFDGWGFDDHNMDNVQSETITGDNVHRKYSHNDYMRMFNVYHGNKNKLQGKMMQCPVCRKEIKKDYVTTAFCSQQCSLFYWHKDTGVDTYVRNQYKGTIGEKHLPEE